MPITEFCHAMLNFMVQIITTEINLDLQESHKVIWREYELIENNPAGEYRRDMTWRVFIESGGWQIF